MAVGASVSAVPLPTDSPPTESLESRREPVIIIIIIIHHHHHRSSLAAHRQDQQLTSSAKAAPPPGPNSGPPPGPNSAHGVFARPGMAGQVIPDCGEAPGPVLCAACCMWCSSPQQYEEHVLGKKHRHNARVLVGPTSDQRYWARYAARYHLQMLYTRHIMVALRTAGPLQHQ